LLNHLSPDGPQVKKVAIYTPTRGDTMTVTITGGSVSTAASQPYALVVSGHIDRGAWYVHVIPWPLVGKKASPVFELDASMRP
jgi:hypothetical protein